MEKIPTLTGIRAFAALWVVLLHFRANQGVAGALDFDWLAARGYWGVDIFFVLSGFILTHTYYRSFTGPDFSLRVFRDFLIKRLARIYPLHLASFLAFAGLLWLGYTTGEQLVNPERCTLSTVAQNLLLIHAWGTTPALNWNYPSWSISAEWFAYLVVFAVALRYLWRRDWRVSGRWVTFSWLAICLFAALRGEGVDMYTTTAVVRIIPEFLAGCLLYRLSKDGFGRSWSGWAPCVAIAGIAALTQLSRNFEFLLLPLVCLLLLGLYHHSRPTHAVFANRPVVFLGEISYSIYLLHPLAQIIGDRLIGRLNPVLEPSVAVVILLGEVALTIVIAALGYFWIERPARRWIVRAFSSRLTTNVSTPRQALNQHL